MTQAGPRTVRDDKAARRREAILVAAGEIFLRRGFEAATTLEIARRAKTSKRALYESFADKHEILTELIRTRTRRMLAPTELPLPNSRTAFFEALRIFGVEFLTQLLDPEAIGIYRLAICATSSAANIGREIHLHGNAPVVASVRRLLEHGATHGWLGRKDVDSAVRVFLDVLIGQQQIRLLLRTESTPSRRALEEKADLAIEILKHFRQTLPSK